MSIDTPSARDRILLTAHHLFYRFGIRATGIDRIIQEAGVTKVTFYRHFPSKDALIMAFLDYRHQHWLAALRQSMHASISAGISPAMALSVFLKHWLSDLSFRGCAFINTTVEMAETLPETLSISQKHKQDVVDCLAQYLPATAQGRMQAEMLVMLMDGAIVKAQRDQHSEPALALFDLMAHRLFAGDVGD